MILSDLLRIQDGLLTRAQANEYGLSDRVLLNRVRSGRWVVVLRGVYATFTGELSDRQRCRAALLWAGSGAMLGGVTAAALHGLRYLPEGHREAVHVLMPHAQRRRNDGFVVLRRGTRLPSAWQCEDMPVAPPARAVVDACRDFTNPRAVRAWVAESVQRGMLAIEQLDAELAAGGSAGSRWSRRALTDVRGGARSAPEAEWRDLILGSDLPRPVFNYTLYSPTGVLIGTPDSYWDEFGVAVEVDSMEWHPGAADWEGTMQRHERLAAYGLIVVHASPSRIRQDGHTLLASVAAALAAAEGRPRPEVIAVAPGMRFNRPA